MRNKKTSGFCLICDFNHEKLPCAFCKKLCSNLLNVLLTLFNCYLNWEIKVLKIDDLQKFDNKFIEMWLSFFQEGDILKFYSKRKEVILW